MKQKAKFLFLLGIVNCQLSIVSSQEHVVPFSFGDMDHWVVREIHESGIIGGNTKHLYRAGADRYDHRQYSLYEPRRFAVGELQRDGEGGRCGEDEYICLP